jgi:hypothetical protein
VARSLIPLPILLLTLLLPVACSHTPRPVVQKASQDPAIVVSPMKSLLPGPQIPKVEFGKRPKGALMTSNDMPYFDEVTYCEHSTRKQDTMRRGPFYEACVQDQDHYRIIIGDGIDRGQFNDKMVEACATASRTAYQGLWYCMNGQEF